MRISYQEGEAHILAEADEIVANGATLTVLLRSGKRLTFPFPSQEVLEDFYTDVVLSSGDKPIRLERTNFDPRLGTLLEEWDALYD